MKTPINKSKENVDSKDKKVLKKVVQKPTTPSTGSKRGRKKKSLLPNVTRDMQKVLSVNKDVDNNSSYDKFADLDIDLDKDLIYDDKTVNFLKDQLRIRTNLVHSRETLLTRLSSMQLLLENDIQVLLDSFFVLMGNDNIRGRSTVANSIPPLSNSIPFATPLYKQILGVLSNLKLITKLDNHVDSSELNDLLNVASSSSASSSMSSIASSVSITNDNSNNNSSPASPTQREISLENGKGKVIDANPKIKKINSNDIETILNSITLDILNNLHK